ncbi:MAG: hypothetical protein ACP6IP_04495 [Candidatus Njordarchaeia archaeon]
MADSSNRNEEVVRVRAICPKCGKNIALNIPREMLKNSQGGITTIPFEHGDPPHLLVLYVDTTGDVRGTVVYEGIIREEDIQKKFLSELIKVVGLKLMSVIAYWMLAKRQIIIKSADSKLKKSVEFLIDNVLDPISKDGENVGAMEIDLSQPPHPDVSLEPLENVFKKILESENPETQLLWIRKELERYKKGLEKLMEIYGRKDTVDKEDLLEELGSYLNYREILILIHILKDMGYDVYKKFDLKELKIKSLFDL